MDNGKNASDNRKNASDNRKNAFDDGKNASDNRKNASEDDKNASDDGKSGSKKAQVTTLRRQGKILNHPFIIVMLPWSLLSIESMYERAYRSTNYNT